MSKREQALKDWEETQQREQYWDKYFAKMRKSEKEEKKVARSFSC